MNKTKKFVGEDEVVADIEGGEVSRTDYNPKANYKGEKWREEALAVEISTKEIKAKHDAEKVKREQDGVVETEAETKTREHSEELELRVARHEVTAEEHKHIDARDQRLKTVKSNIEAARLARVELEKTGVMETEGVKLDREAKEAKDLEEASVLNIVEDFSISNAGNPDLNAVVEKLKEVINHLNRCQ